MKSNPCLKQAAVLLLAALLLFGRLSSFPLTDRDEGEYAASCSEMIKRGEYVVPYLNGRPYLEKPILFFWIVACSFTVFGENEFGARLPSAVAAFCLLWFMMVFTNHYLKEKTTGLLSVLILLSSPLFMLIARACLTDMILSLFVWLSLVLFYAFMQDGHKLVKLSLSWLFLSLGFLTKGPVAIAMCVPVFLIYSFLKQDFSWLRPRMVLVGIVIFLTVNLPWYLSIYLRQGHAFIETFFVTQNIERFTTTLLGHGGGPFFYLAVLLIGMFPISGFIPFLIKKGYDSLKARHLGSTTGQGKSLVDFCLLSFCWILLLLSLSATKQINYVVPALPFLAVAMALTLTEDAKGYSPSLLANLTIWLVAACLIMLSVVLLVWPDGMWNTLTGLVRFDSTEYAFPLMPPSRLRCWGESMIIVAVTCISLCSMKRWGLKACVVAGVMFSAFFVAYLLPDIACTFQRPAKMMALKVGKVAQWEEARTNRKVRMLSFGLWKPSMIFYSSHHIMRIKTKHRNRLETALLAKGPCFVFTRKKVLRLVGNIRTFRTICERDGYLLGGNQEALVLMNRFDSP